MQAPSPAIDKLQSRPLRVFVTLAHSRHCASVTARHIVPAKKDTAKKNYAPKGKSEPTEKEQPANESITHRRSSPTQSTRRKRIVHTTNVLINTALNATARCTILHSLHSTIHHEFHVQKERRPRLQAQGATDTASWCPGRTTGFDCCGDGDTYHDHCRDFQRPGCCDIYIYYIPTCARCAAHCARTYPAIHSTGSVGARPGRVNTKAANSCTDTTS